MRRLGPRKGRTPRAKTKAIAATYARAADCGIENDDKGAMIGRVLESAATVWRPDLPPAAEGRPNRGEPTSKGAGKVKGDRSVTIDAREEPKRILVIDDDPDVADTLVMLLARAANARAAYSGPAGLECLKAFEPEVVLLDLGMPGMDGFETARRIRSLPNGDAIKLIAYTAWSKERVGDRVRETGFDDHLTKPVNYSELCRAVLCPKACAERDDDCAFPT